MPDQFDLDAHTALEPDKNLLDIPDLELAPLRILSLLQDREFSMTAFAEAAALDPVIEYQLIRVASSPYYGIPKPFDDVKRAIVHLGIRSALSIALGLSLFRNVRKGVGTADEQWCWRRLILNAVTARDLARHSGRDSVDEAFLLGMVMDFGLLLLIEQRPRHYHRLLVDYRQRQAPFAWIELAEKGMTHAAVTAALLEHWGFPESYRVLIERHHDGVTSARGEDQLLAILRLAELTSDLLLMPSPTIFHAWESGWNLVIPSNSIDRDEFLDDVVAGTRHLADILKMGPTLLRSSGLIAGILKREIDAEDDRARGDLKKQVGI